jgi:hypothetical protein
MSRIQKNWPRDRFFDICTPLQTHICFGLSCLVLKKNYCRRYVWYWCTYVEDWSKSIVIIRRSPLSSSIHYFIFWLPILRRSCHLKLRWLIIIDLSNLGSPQKYHITQALYERSSLTQLPYSQHYIAQQLPPYMNDACAALKNNSIQCSYCAKTVLTIIGILSVNSSYSMILTRFDSKESFIDHCVEEIYSRYIHCQGYKTWWKSSFFLKCITSTFSIDARLQQ